MSVAYRTAMKRCLLFVLHPTIMLCCAMLNAAHNTTCFEFFTLSQCSMRDALNWIFFSFLQKHLKENNSFLISSKTLLFCTVCSSPADSDKHIIVQIAGCAWSVFNIVRYAHIYLQCSVFNHEPVFLLIALTIADEVGRCFYVLYFTARNLDATSQKTQWQRCKCV